MNIILDGPIDQEAFDKLVRAYNDIEEKGGALHIFFSSEGGEISTGEAMVELINRNANVTTITIFGIIASMGFKLFADVKCAKVILDSAYAICHLSRWRTEILEGGKALDDFARFKEKKMKKSLGKSLAFYEDLGFKEEEITDMKAGKDLYLDVDRLRRMFRPVR